MATVSFSSATYQYEEGAGDVQITVTRSGNIESKAIVLVASDDFQGTAAGWYSYYIYRVFYHEKHNFCIVGDDYKSLSTILEFEPGETVKRVTITIIDDKKIERDEFFQLYLSAGEGVHLNPFARAEIMIINNDASKLVDGRL